jgi:hypothetical protein
MCLQNAFVFCLVGRTNAITSERSKTVEMEVVHCAVRAEPLNIMLVILERPKCCYSIITGETKVCVERDLKPGPHEATTLRCTGTRHCVQFHLH